MSAATDRTREVTPTNRGSVVHDQGRRPSYDTQSEAPARFESALPSYDVVLRTTQSMPSLTPSTLLPVELGTPLSDVACVDVRSCLTGEPCSQSAFARFATSSPTLGLTRRWDVQSACGVTGKPRVCSAIPLPARLIGPAEPSSVSSSDSSSRPPTSASIRSDENLSIATRSSATTPLSSTGYASSPLSAVSGGLGPLSSVDGRERPFHSDLATTMRGLAAHEREVSDQVNARMSTLEAMVAAWTERTLEEDRAVTPASESRPFTPVHIPPGFEEGLASYFEGTFDPRSPHRRRRGTLPPQGGLRVDTRAADRCAPAADSRPLTPVPLPPNFAHDLQEYFRASMEPHSPESCRRRAEHRERAATVTALRERASSVVSEWPSSPETPPLDEDADSELSDDPIEVIEGVLKAECEQLYVSLSRRGSVALAPGAEAGASRPGRPLPDSAAKDGPSAKAAALGSYVEETKARKKTKDRDAMCSKWLEGLEPVLARVRPFA